MNTLILHLSLIKGIGPVGVDFLIKRLEDNHITDPYSMTVADLQHIGVSLKQAEIIREGLQDNGLLEKELECYDTYSIEWSTYKDERYPELLKHVYAPPAVITWRGNITYDKAMAIVGSRDATEYGKQTVDFFVPQLVYSGYTIVSGGAYGIDAWAHEATMKSGGKTIVVLGSGLERPYPREHIKLFKKVVEDGGAIVSIFPVMTSAAPGNFPARNRVIAGLSQGCIVVQAAEKSGARITADFALQQGRSVFAVPGLINHPLSEGCHDLIKQGATMLTSFEDIAQEFGITQYRKPIILSSKGTEATEISQNNIKPVFEKPTKIEETNLHPILKLCKVPQSFDDLLQKFPEKNQTELQSILFDLSLDGLIEQDFTGMWNSI